MKARFRLGVLLVTAVATLAVASPAMARGGGGTGGGGGGGGATTGCATIQSWTDSVQTVLSGPTVVMTIGVVNGCLDEGGGAGRLPAVTMTSTDTATGAWLSASTYMANYGLNHCAGTGGVSA